MPINTKESYIEIGTSVNADNTLNNVLHLPCPVELPSSNEFLVDAGRNADGVMWIEQIGRTQYTTQIKWARLENKKWWQINRWFETYGYVFYMKYFSHTEGRVKIHKFYRGNIDKGNPSNTTEIMNNYVVPTHYLGCGFSIIDIGDDDVIIEEEMVVI
jgi:hypothetical protein